MNPLALIGSLVGALFGGSGTASAVTNVAKIGGFVVAAPLAWDWFQGHQNQVVLTLNVSQALALALFAVALLQVAHSARGPGQ